MIVFSIGSPRMQVILWMTSLQGSNCVDDEGGRERTHDGEASMWHRHAPTWGRVASTAPPYVEMEDGTSKAKALDSSREPLMALSGQGSVGNIGECEVVKGDVCCILWLV